MNPADPPHGPRQVGLLHWLDAAAAPEQHVLQPLLVSAPVSRARTPRAGPARRGRRRALLLVSLGATAVGMGVLALPHTHSGTAAAPAGRTMDSVPNSAAAASPGSAGGCKPSQDPGVVRGNGPGGKDTGPNAILWFEHAYYIARDARTAREVVSDDAAVSPVQRLQSGIDSVPAGTTYCVTIHSDTAPGALLVDIDEARPSEPPQTWHQRITTTTRDGRTVITAIAAA